MNEVKLQADVGVNSKNIAALVQAVEDQASTITGLKERLTRAENNLSILQSNLANTKQLIGHVMGRGMGATTE